ncbi:MAG: Uma2 family endonuclease [Pseudaminobacter sp.]|nr:Uma2 family endonuclease [Pseudaminobacter sp.]
MTADEYLHWSQEQPDGRYELVSGEVVMMSPETVRHVAVKNQAWLTFRNAIEKARLSYRAYGDGVGVRVDQFTVREPDMSIQCKPVSPDSLLLDEPVVVVEVILPTSVRSDTGAKVAEYFKVPSVRHYLIIDPFNSAVIRHSRPDEGAVMMTEIHRSGLIVLDPPGLTVRTEDLLFNDTNQDQETP